MPVIPNILSIVTFLPLVGAGLILIAHLLSKRGEAAAPEGMNRHLMPGEVTANGGNGRNKQSKDKPQRSEPDARENDAGDRLFRPFDRRAGRKRMGRHHGLREFFITGARKWKPHFPPTPPSEGFLRKEKQ